MKAITLIAAIFLVNVNLARSSIDFKNGGYESVTISISKNVAENLDILIKLKEILKQASNTLWHASKNRAYFREFNIIVPSHWSDQPGYETISNFCKDKPDIIVDNDQQGDEPFTQQSDDCGKPGQFIYLPTNFIIGSEENKDKKFIHEWAHLRYGVFDEHGTLGDPEYPPLTLTDNGEVIGSVCVKADGYIENSNGDICEISQMTQQADPSCDFIPFDDMKASLMFKPIQDTVDGFCDDTEGGEYKHNELAKTKHNVKCNGRSVSSIILGHNDFRNQTRIHAPLTIEPKINIKRISDVNSNEIFVLTFDVSGSMSGLRIQVLSKGSQEFIKTSVPDGVKLGLVQFHTYSKALHDIVTVDSRTRQSLLAKVPNVPLNLTSIGAGLSESLNMIDRFGGYSQANIVLISDGEENASPKIPEVLPRILANSKIRIITFALSNSASSKLEELAAKTGGYGLFFSLMNVPDATTEAQKVAASLLDVVSSTCDKEIKQSPNKVIYNESSNEFELSKADKRVKLEIPISSPGKRIITFDKKKGYGSESIPLSIYATSQPSANFMRSSSSYSITLESSISHAEAKSDNPPKIFGYLKRGYDPILMATVSARVERPDGTYANIKLADNGIGSDAVKNDGIYSAYFTDYTRTGRYNVLVSASSDGTAKSRSSLISRRRKNASRYQRTIASVNKTFSLDHFNQIIYFSKTYENSVPIHAFSRVQNAGAFNLRSFSNYDRIPPIKVTDLSIGSIDESSKTIELVWTSAGDDLTSGTAKKIQIRADRDLAKLQSDSIFDSLYLLTDRQVIQGSLNPLSGGQKHLIKLSVDNFWSADKFSVHFALKTIDKNNNVSPKSNIISAYFGVLKRLNILYSSINTLKKQTISQKFDINIKNSTKNGNSIIDTPVVDFQNLKIYFRTPKGKMINDKCNCIVKDEINGKLVLNYEDNLFGTWNLYIQRISITSAEDINFSIKTIVS